MNINAQLFGPDDRSFTQRRIKETDEAFNQQLMSAFEQRLGQTAVISKRHSFPLQMRHVKQYTGSHWILMGDAAHTIHPLAGLGLNLGLADLTGWLALLEESTASFMHEKKPRHLSTPTKARRLAGHCPDGGLEDAVFNTLDTDCQPCVDGD